MSDDSIATQPTQAHVTIRRATHGSPDHPLVIGEVEIPCYVLEDGTRVLAMNGIYTALSMSRGGLRRGARLVGDRLTRFAATKAISPFISNELTSRITEPLKFRTPQGSVAKGYEATILPELCEAVLRARSAGLLQNQQLHIAARAETLMYGFARIGVIALVDEATGYQEKRDRDELHRILALYLTDERLGWARRFPDEYFKQLARLWGWTWPNIGGKTPRYVGHLTNRLIYDKMPAGVLEELKKKNPTGEESGRRKWRHHQFLTEDFGQPDLRDHIMQLVAVMRASANREIFERNFAAAFPTPGEQLRLLDDVEYTRVGA